MDIRAYKRYINENVIENQSKMNFFKHVKGVFICINLFLMRFDKRQTDLIKVYDFISKSGHQIKFYLAPTVHRPGGGAKDLIQQFKKKY